MSTNNSVAALFLRKNRPLVDGLTSHWNKQQKLNSLVIEALSGTPYPVNEILPDKLIVAVDAHGPEILQQVFVALDKQMDDVLAALAKAHEEATAEPEATVHGEVGTKVEVPDETPISEPAPVEQVEQVLQERAADAEGRERRQLEDLQQERENTK